MSYILNQENDFKSMICFYDAAVCFITLWKYVELREQLTNHQFSKIHVLFQHVRHTFPGAKEHYGV